MSRFGWRPGRRRNGWSGTAPEERSRPTSPDARRALPVLTPDRDSRLSDGVVIETRLRARVLGAPLLKVDGTVLVSPARLVASTPPTVVRGTVVSDAHTVSGAAPRSQGVAPGTALAQAASLLEESRKRLRAVDGHH